MAAWKMSTGPIRIIPKFSGFHEEEFTLSPKDSFHCICLLLQEGVTQLLVSFCRSV
jgi:hypothetical protein